MRSRPDLPNFLNGAKLTLRECGPGAILCNPERVLSVIHAVPSVPKSEFCGIAFQAAKCRVLGVRKRLKLTLMLAACRREGCQNLKTATYTA